MISDIWSATLSPTSPRYADWREILGGDTLPLRSPIPLKAKLDGELELVYLIDWPKLDWQPSQRLIDFIVGKFNAPREVVERQLDSDEVFPIRKDDVVVSISLRAFL